MLSRRDVVVSFLGVAAAKGAACRAERRREVPGSLVDRAFETGHLLRGPPLPRASEETGSVDVLVVGGGLAGLTAAWRLRSAGVERVLLLELDSELGGTARSGRNEASAFPWGAHYVPAPLRHRGPMSRLLAEMGLVTGVSDDGTATYAEGALVHEPEERLFYRGQWYEGLYLRAGATAEDLHQLARFEHTVELLAAARDARGRKAFDVPLEVGSDDAEWTQLDGISMAHWLEREGFTSPRLRWWVDYACRDDYGALAADVSAWAGLWYFAARRSGTQASPGNLSWPEGNGRLVNHLASSVGRERILSHRLVHTLEQVEGASEWVAHTVEVGTLRPARFRARQVVLAVPRMVAVNVVAPWRLNRPPFFSAFQSTPWVVANLTLKEQPRSRGFPLAWDNVLYESASLGYVVATHQRARADPSGPTVLTWYYPLTGTDPVAERTRLLSTTYSDWEAIVMADLMPAHRDFAAQVTSLEVMRWGHAMVRPGRGFVWGPQRREAQASLGSLHLAHTDLSGLPLVEEATWHGVRAAEQALEGLARRSRSWLE